MEGHSLLHRDDDFDAFERHLGLHVIHPLTFDCTDPGRASISSVMSTDSTAPSELIEEVLALLRGGQAHAGFDAAVQYFPVELRGVAPERLPYSAWQLVEHMRIAHRDILNFSAPPTGGYHAMKWPEDYWPKSPAPPSASAWDESIAAIHSDRKLFEALLQKPGVDLYKPFRWGDGQNLLREALLIADHNAYHVGELILLRRLLGVWHM